MVQERSAASAADSVGKVHGLVTRACAFKDARITELTLGLWTEEANFSGLELLARQDLCLPPWSVEVVVIGASDLVVVRHDGRFAAAYVLACGNAFERVSVAPVLTTDFRNLINRSRPLVADGVRLEMTLEVRPFFVGVSTRVNSAWHESARRVALAVGFPSGDDGWGRIEVISDLIVHSDRSRPLTIVTGIAYDRPDELELVLNTRHEYPQDGPSGLVAVSADRLRVRAPTPTSGLN